VLALSLPVPPAPAFGAPCPLAPSPDTLALLADRRSTSAQLLVAPGPDDAELADLLRLAARVPDHGKMQPWRFIVLRGACKARFVAGLQALALERPDPVKAQAALAKIAAPPVCVAVVSAPREGGQPVWEQELSAGAACMTLLIAADAMGFGANWITDWYGYAPEATALLELAPNERLAGWIMIGTASETPLERVRPDMASVVTAWAG
jgi:nitroreductase